MDSNSLKLNEKNIKHFLSASKGKNVKQLTINMNSKFSGPSFYFYKKTIEKIRKNDYSSLFEDEQFFEYMYSTLACWGMHRMDKNTRMIDFDAFKCSILMNKTDLVRLSKEKLMDANIDLLEPTLLRIFDSLRIMARAEAPKFVAHSKIMHFLLPDLVPPMDKGQIFRFFSKTKNLDKKNEKTVFIELVKQFKKIATNFRLSDKDIVVDTWDLSIPKIVDNMIISYNSESR